MSPKFFVRLLFLPLVLFTVIANAQFAKIGFWKRTGPFLRFTTAVQTAYLSSCSNVTTIQAANSMGAAYTLATPRIVDLSATGVTFYSDANCTAVITSVTIAASANSASFYFMADSVGSKTIVAAYSTYTSGQQTETVAASPFVWTGGGANANWATGLNWSGGAAPGAGSQAIFDGTCSANCSPTIAASISVSGIRMLTGYGGTITQAAGQTVTIGTAGWYQEAGLFAGGTSAITFNGPFTLTGGSYTGTSANTAVASSFVVSGAPTFTSASPTYVFSNRGTISLSTGSFTNVTFNPGNGALHTIAGTMLVNGNLVLNSTTSNTTLSGGTIEVKGNLTVTSYGYPGTTLIKLTGDVATTQTVDATAVTLGASNRNLSSFEIASNGTVNLSGTLYVNGTFTYTSAAAFSAGTSHIVLSPNGTSGATTHSMGAVTYYDLSTYGSHSVNFATDVNVGNDLTLQTVLFNSGGVNGPGKVNLTRNLVLKSYGSGQAGNLRVVTVGVNQTIDNSLMTDINAYTPSLEINSTGTVTFPATYGSTGDFKYVQGTIAGLTAVRFAGLEGLSHSIELGALSLTNVSFVGRNGNTYTIVGTLNMTGDLVFAGIGNSIVIGDIDLQGNLTYTNFYNPNHNLTFSGGGNQTITYTNITTTKGTITVNKSGGTLTLLTNLAWDYGSQGAFSIVNGSLDMNGKNLTLRTISTLNGNTITKNGGVLTVGGAVIPSGAAYGGQIDP